MPLSQAQDVFNKEKEEAIEWLHNEIGSLRSNRVKPDIILNLQVEAYGTRNQMQSIASVTSSDARTLVISPYDKGTMQAIEKAVTEANLGVQPIVEGMIIRLVFPSLTDEVRKQTLKLLHNKVEEARVRMRQGRDEALRLLKQEREKGDLPEDDFYNGKEELDKMIGDAGKEVDAIVQKKETDIAAI
ncbi:MAG: ribosome recycling factor [Candidatus Andersenbacteria bacterium]|nr:ribosome recycling factor [Candidatus Andersenbacteria bacterium]MBI3250337.1 ribosome recycling factor [Candidatus Andersenbacteria bacterium]